MDFISFLKFISVWSILMPFTAGIILFKKLDFDSKIILLVVLGGIIPQVLSNKFLHTLTFQNITYNLYIPFEFSCYALLFHKKYTFPKLKLIYKLTLLFFSLLSLFLLLHNNISTLFLNQWVILNNIIQLIWVGMYLIQVYLNDDLQFEADQPFFWFLIAIICYASCTTVFYSLWYIVLSNAFTKYRFVEIIHHLFNISLYFLFFVGILKNKIVKNTDGRISK